MNPASSTEALQQLWSAAGGPAHALEAVQVMGREPALPSSFAVGTAAQASIAASALAAAELGALRGGPQQTVEVDMRHAAVEFRSERYLQSSAELPAGPWDRIAGLYRCRDGHVRLHTNFPHHRDGVLRLLGCDYDRDAVGRALAGWDALAFEQAAAEAGLCVTALRTFDEWDRHPQAIALRDEPLLAFERLDDTPPRPLPALPSGERPLSGLRVLDLTRIIAGPVGGRTLAAHGADVLLITGPHLPSIPVLVVDTGRGKRSAQLDLRTPADADTLRRLVREADVLIQGYRPGSLAALGFDAASLARERPGLVVVSLAAYGFSGPWAERRGFDSLVQTASGFNVAEAEAAGSSEPRVLPAQALDHASGYLMALGALRGLHRRATEGGSWHIKVSLARTGLWLRGLGRLADGLGAHDPSQDDVADLLETTPSGFGPLTAVRHAGRLSHTPAHWSRPSVPLGTDAPRWD